MSDWYIRVEEEKPFVKHIDWLAIAFSVVVISIALAIIYQIIT